MERPPFRLLLLLFSSLKPEYALSVANSLTSGGGRDTSPLMPTEVFSPEAKVAVIGKELLPVVWESLFLIPTTIKTTTASRTRRRASVWTNNEVVGNPIPPGGFSSPWKSGAGVVRDSGHLETPGYELELVGDDMVMESEKDLEEGIRNSKIDYEEIMIMGDDAEVDVGERLRDKRASEIASGSSTDGECPSGLFQCRIDPSLCVPQAAICNGKAECPDSSDEADCENLHAKKYWDIYFQKRPGADSGKNDTCKYILPGNNLSSGEQSSLAKKDVETSSSSSSSTSLSTASSAPVFRSGEALLGSCHCSVEELFCQNLHLPNLNIIPRDVVFLDLSGSRVANLSFLTTNNTSSTPNNSSGSTFMQLQTLILSSNALIEIQLGLFHPLTSLEALHLTGNRLTSLGDHPFSTNTKLKKLFLGYNQLLTLTENAFSGLHLLQELDLRNNKLTGKESNLFVELKNLRILHLSYNEIESVGRDMFKGLDNLEMLTLTKNRISYIEQGAFQGMTLLNHLYLSFNQLEVVEDRTFCSLTSLLDLNLNDNGIIRIEADAFECLDSLQSLVLKRNKFGELDDPKQIFANLTKLQHIDFDQFWMCWWAPQVRNCEPKGDGISSVENLLDNILLRTCVWLMGLVGVVGNLFVIVSRMVLREKNRVHSFYIKNLAVADLLMGIFLLSIAFHDVSYRGEFLARQHSWRHSLTCQWSGLLSTLASESSVLILTLITLDRYLSIVRPFIERRNAMIPAIAFILFLWIVSFLLSYAPLSGLFPGYFGSTFYTSNGLCLPLHIHNPFDKGWEYSFVLFVAINSIAFTFICYAYWRMLRIIQTSTTSIRSTQQKQDGMLAKRFGLVVMTDFLCWAPVIISKTLAMCGVQIPSDFYAWLAVFVLPVNSALNPIIYTLTTKLFKQQVAHFSIGFRKRLGLTTDDSTTSSLFYRNRISRTLNTSVSGSMMMSTKRNSRMERNPHQQIRNRYTVSAINCVVASSTGLGLQLNNGQANPVEAFTNDVITEDRKGLHHGLAETQT